MSDNNFLHDKDDRTIRNHILNGVKDVHRNETLFAYSQFCHFLATRLWPTDNAHQRAVIDQWNRALRPPESSSQGVTTRDDADTKRIVSILWEFVAEGIFYPRFEIHNINSPYTSVHFGLTPRGVRLLSDLEAHPLSSEFIRRFRSQAPLMTVDVVACVENAVECLRHQILRAGVMLIGVAAEITVRITHDALVASNKLNPLNTPPGKPPSARKLLDRSFEEISKNWTNLNEERRNLTQDLTYLDSLREARNRAAHPEQAKFSPEEVERFIDLASRSIARIWRVIIEPIVTSGQLVLT